MREDNILLYGVFRHSSVVGADTIRPFYIQILIYGGVLDMNGLRSFAVGAIHESPVSVWHIFAGDS